MKLSILSDLHLEFCEAPQLPGGDILAMAGDIFSAFSFDHRKNDADSRGARRRAEKFAKEQLSKYDRVLYVPGNHEFYRGVIETAPDLLRCWFAEHVPHGLLLDNEVAEIGGVTFMGTTLWSKCGAGNPTDAFFIRKGMRDFHVIKTTAPPVRGMALLEGTRNFDPIDANRLFEENKFWLAETIPADKPVVLITHHAPSFQSGCDARLGSNLDDAYCGDIVDFILGHPNIKLAIHGHTHHREHYHIGQTLVVANSRGYFPQEAVSRTFDPSAEDLDLEELKA